MNKQREPDIMYEEVDKNELLNSISYLGSIEFTTTIYVRYVRHGQEAGKIIGFKTEEEKNEVYSTLRMILKLKGGIVHD